MFRVCSDGVQLLRTLTKRLCTSAAIAEELDNTDQYLAFRELKTLHQHMEGSKEGEDDLTNEQLSLESLKVMITLNYIFILTLSFYRTPAICLPFKIPSFFVV